MVNREEQALEDAAVKYAFTKRESKEIPPHYQ